MEEVPCKDPSWMKTEEGTFYPAGTKCYLDPSQASCFLFGNSGSGVARRICNRSCARCLNELDWESLTADRLVSLLKAEKLHNTPVLAVPDQPATVIWSPDSDAGACFRSKHARKSLVDAVLREMQEKVKAL